MLHIHLFGNLRVFDGDVALPPLNPPKALTLLAYLLLRRERTIPRDQVAFTLWADVSEAEARANLRRHLHLLRRYLPPPAPGRPWLLTEHETVQWNRQSDYWLDIQAFDQVVNEARQLDRDASAQAAVASLQSAVEHYNGDLLENVYEDWALVERERLREQYTGALEQLTALQKSAGDIRGAIATTKRLLAHNPLREETHRQLMEFYYQAGDRAAALQQFEECRRLLREDLDVEPMPETLALRQAILDGVGHRVLSPPPPSVPHAANPTPSHAERSDQPASRTVAAGRSVRSPAIFSRLSVRARWMLTAVFLALVAASLLLWRALSPSPVTVTLSGPGVVQDTWITSEYPDSPLNPEFPDKLFKDYNQVHLQFYGFDVDRFLIRFDVSAIPANAQVSTASLLIHLETWIADSGQNNLQRAYPAIVTAYRIRRPWQPESATFDIPWTQPGMAPGTDYDIEPLASQLIEDTAWLSFDVTPAVRDWLTHADDNWGIMLKITDASEDAAHYWVDTTNHPTPERRPRLVVTYHSP